MINLAIAFGLGVAAFLAAAFVFSPIAGVLPGILVTAGSLFFLTRRVGGLIEAEMLKLAPMLQAGKVDEAKAHLEHIRKQYGQWQILLDRQLDAQLGMLDYLRLKWDDALPLLERGRIRNWQAQVCIGAIHHRQGRPEKAWPEFESAAGVAPKEAIIYVVWAVLLVKSGERNKALSALGQGITALPDSELLASLQKTIANKKKIDTRKFPEVWFQFFPEDLLAAQRVRGRRGGPGPGFAVQQPRIGARSAPRR